MKRVLITRQEWELFLGAFCRRYTVVENPGQLRLYLDTEPNDEFYSMIYSHAEISVEIRVWKLPWWSNWLESKKWKDGE